MQPRGLCGRPCQALCGRVPKGDAHYCPTSVWSRLQGPGQMTIVALLQVTKAKIRVEATPWQRVTMDGKPHNHGEQAEAQLDHPATALALACS